MLGMESGSLMFDNAIDFKIHQIVMQIWNRDIDDEGRNIYIQNASGKSIISHSKFYEFNSAGSYGNHISISMFGEKLPPSFYSHLTISNCTFMNAAISAVSIRLQNIRSVFIRITQSHISLNEGTGIAFASDHSIAFLHITDCRVTHNMYGGLYFKIKPSTPTIQIVIENVIISDNKLGIDYEGAGMAVKTQGKVEKGPIFIIKNVSFIRNEHYGTKRSLSAVSLYKVRYVTFIDCTFTANRGTAVRAFRTSLYITGRNRFINNSATEGGAIALL